MGEMRVVLPATASPERDEERQRRPLNRAARGSRPNPLGGEAASGVRPLFARLETLALLLALFLFATGGGFLGPGMEAHAKGSATVVSASSPTGPLHSLELAVALGISLYLVISRWRHVLRLSLRMWPFTASAILAILSSLWSIDPLLSLRSGLYLLINTLLVYFLVQRYTLEGLLRLMMGLGVVVAVLSIATAVLLPSYAWTSAGSHWGLQGAFIAKNTMGNAGVLLLTPALFLRDLRPFLRASYIFVFTVLIALSFSVQAWAAALFCFAFAGAGILFRRLRKQDVLWMTYTTLLPAAMALLLLLTYRIEILQFLGKDPTLSGRTIIWDAVLHSALKRPVLGWGYNAFWQGFVGESGAVLLRVHFPISQSQNGPLEVLLGLGCVGVGLLLATFLQSFRYVLRCFRLGATDAAAWFVMIILLTLYYSVGEAYMEQPNMLVWMMYILACTGLVAEVCRARASRTVALEEAHELRRAEFDQAVSRSQ